MDGAGRLAEKLRPQADLKAAAIGAVVLLREYFGLGRAAKKPLKKPAKKPMLDREPPDPKNKLFALDNVIFSPHMAGVTRESMDRMAAQAVRNGLSVLDGRPIRENVVNQDVLD